ncbi:hypothetical protein D3C85_1589050 [compost metagenome]
MALIINAQNPNNIGAMVDVLRFVNKGDPLPEINDEQLSTITGWLVSGDIKNCGGNVGFGTSYAKDLLPIKPEADPLDVTHKEELHA